MNTINLHHFNNIQSFVNNINQMCFSKYMGAQSSENMLALNFVHTHSFVNKISSLNILVERLQKSGYFYIDSAYLQESLIHAKFSHEYDIWADTNTPWRRSLSELVVEFSIEYVMEKERTLAQFEFETKEDIVIYLKEAIHAFDIAVTESIPAWSIKPPLLH